MANEATATQGTVRDAATERIRIEMGLNMFELWNDLESQPVWLNDAAALRAVEETIGIPVAALALEVGRLIEPSVSFRVSNFAEIDADPLLKSILIERDADADQEE